MPWIAESKMENCQDLWRVGGVSVAGFAHVDENMPCQDAHAYVLRDGCCLVAAVADGAGSARFGHLGAAAIASAVVEVVSKGVSGARIDFDLVSKLLIEAVNETTKNLIQKPECEANGVPLRLSDFATTLVAVVANQSGGRFFHVGDGAGTALALNDPTEATTSKPQNGEYANETFFVTMENWERYLETISFDSNFDTILLMSDGVTPLAMSRGCESPFMNFVAPVIEFVRTADDDTAKTALTNTLLDNKVRMVTGDDKTLLWATKVGLSR
jgi:hypothetical protein